MTDHVDTDSKKRIIRGIEIAEHFSKEGNTLKKTELPYKPYYIGIKTEPEPRKKQIASRLLKRLDEGLIAEVELLLSQGITAERLEFLGLEYKFVIRYLKQELTKDELVLQLQTAIFQFAKRQMTWFRKMEKEGVNIHWVEKDAATETWIKELKKELV